MKKFFLLAAAAVAMTASAQDMYIIGSNVNGEEWALGTNQMENKGNGVYEWTGEVLGAGFKFNDGTWNNKEYDFGVANLGSNGEKLILGEEYYYSADSGSGNIDFEGMAEVTNPKVVLNVAEGYLVVTGDAGKEPDWYITGTFNGWSLADPMTKIDEDNYEMKGVEFVLPVDETTNEKAENGELKVVTSGWGEQYGSSDEVPAEVTPETLSLELGLVGGEGGACPFTIEGTYDAAWNKATHTLVLTVANSDDNAVEGIYAEDVEAVYYNLQGVKVANPVNGIFVKVAGKKATKVNVVK